MHRINNTCLYNKLESKQQKIQFEVKKNFIYELFTLPNE